VSRAAALLAVVLLALLGGAYYFTYEPAPHVTVRWREGATFDRRVDVERWFGLVRARDREGRTVSYDLVDTRPANIQELLEQPEVEAAGDIDETTYAVPADVPYGRGGMWIGDRLPEARAYRVVPVVVALCGLVIAYAVAKAIASRRKRALRLLAFVLGSRRPRFQRADRQRLDRREDRS
jgi:hypothetical protein